MEGWKQRHHEASTAMDGREERLDELYEEIEKDMMVSPPDAGFAREFERLNTLLMA